MLRKGGEKAPVLSQAMQHVDDCDNNATSIDNAIIGN